MGYEYVGVIGDTIIAAGGLGTPDYDISLDNGMSWQYYCYPGFEEPVEKCFVFKQKFFFTTSEGSLYYSSNGFDWTRATNDGFYIDMFCISPNYIVAGSREEGFYYSTDGDIWFPIEYSFNNSI
jgi:hypothetical protein